MSHLAVAGHLLDPSLDVRLLFAHGFDILMLEMAECNCSLRSQLHHLFLRRLASEHEVLLSNPEAGLTTERLKLPLKLEGLWNHICGAHS